MRLLLVAAAVLLVVLIGLLLISRARHRDAVQDAAAPTSKLSDAYVRLRNQALALKPEDAGVQATQADPPTVYGVIMETGYPEPRPSCSACMRRASSHSRARARRHSMC